MAKRRSPTDDELDAFGRRFDAIHADARALYDRYEGLMEGVPADEVRPLLDEWSNLWDRLLECVGQVFESCTSVGDALRAQKRGLFDSRITPCAELLAGDSGLFSLRMSFRTSPTPRTPPTPMPLQALAPEVRELLKQQPVPAPEPAPKKTRRKRGTR